MILKHKREIELAVDLAFAACVAMARKNPPGCELENIGFPQFNRLGAVFYVLIEAVLPYALKKYSRTSATVARAHKLHRLANFLIFLRFLKTGVHASLTELLLGIRYHVVNPSNKRFLDNEFLNRTVIWRHFYSLLLAVLPVLQSTIFPKMLELIYTYSSYLGYANQALHIRRQH